MSDDAAEPRPVPRVRSLARLLVSPSGTWLAIRALAWLCALPLLKRAVPLGRLVRLMWTAPRVRERDPDREAQTVRIVARLSRTSGGNCLERSLVLYRYLAHANADPRLIVGMARPGDYLGHVWVTVDGRPLLETDATLRPYEEVSAFGWEGRRLR